MELPPLVETITLEMGKPIAEARAEIEKCALSCCYYADHTPTFRALLLVDVAWLQA